jgi:hypothetical protein
MAAAEEALVEAEEEVVTIGERVVGEVGMSRDFLITQIFRPIK